MYHPSMIADAMRAVVCPLLERTDIRRATKFLRPDLVVKATWVGHFGKRERQRSMVVTVGRPNYVEREAVKILLKARKPFPVKKVGLKAWAKTRLRTSD